MRSHIRFVVGMAVVLAVSAGILVAEEAAAVGAVAAPSAPKAPKVPSYRGMLTAKPADAAAGVVAVLKVTKKEKEVETETVYSVSTTDEALAKKIADLLTKGVKVIVKGELTADGKGINAVSAEELAVHRPPAHTPKKVEAAAPAEAPKKVDTPPPAAQ